MICAVYVMRATAVFCLAVAAFASDGREVPQGGHQEPSPLPRVNYIDAIGSERIARPVSFTYFTTDVRDAPLSHTGAFPPVPSLLGIPPEVKKAAAPPRERAPVSADSLRQQSFASSHQEQTRPLPSASRRTVRFPLNTVLPGNSLRFDHEPYPELLRAVNAFSDLTPSRELDEGVLVTHNTVLLPATDEGVTTASRTRITNREGYGEGASYPYREFTETTRNTRGDGGSLIERTQRLRVHQDLDEDPAESRASSKTGREADENRYESERGETEEEDQSSSKSEKGEKEYKKDRRHREEAKGHHDKERDSSKLEENRKKEKKFHENEEFYGEHHKSEKGGKEKKYGEGGKRKKGHATHGEHNIVKKDEFIKNTKFYDVDHGDGEHEERGEFRRRQEEKHGGKKEGGNGKSNYEKRTEEKEKSRDKGQEEENHRSRESGSGREEHLEREEEHGGKKSGHSLGKWEKPIGNHHQLQSLLRR